MNIVIINGSQRKNGNCERFVWAAKEILERKHSVNVFTLIDMNINYCSGCLKCEEGMECLLHDDFAEILEPALMKSNLVIMATPTYFNMPSAAMVNFIDRTNKMCDYFMNNKKKCLFYLVGQTDEQTIMEAYNCLHTYGEIMGMEEILDPIITVSRMPKGITQDILEVLERL